MTWEKYKIQEQLFSRNTSFFWIKNGGFFKSRSKVLRQIKPRFSFRLKIDFRRMVRNKHVDLKKIVKFVRSKWYLEHTSKDKGKKANFIKSCKNFKVTDGHHLTYKGERRVIADNENTALPFYFTVIQYSFTIFELQQYLIPFFLQESLESTYLPKEYLFTRKKRLTGVFISCEIMIGSRYSHVNNYWGVIF